MLPTPTLMELTAMVPTPTTPSARGPLMPMLMPTMAPMDTDMLPPATDTTPTPPMLPTPTLMELTAMVPTPTTPSARGPLMLMPTMALMAMLLPPPMDMGMPDVPTLMPPTP